MFCESNQIQPVYEWVQRADNWRADQASKLTIQQHQLRKEHSEKEIRSKLMELDGVKRVGKPYGRNHFLGKVAVFLPKFHQVDERVEMIRSQLEEAIIVVPRWPAGGAGHDWYRRLMEHSVGNVVLGRVRDWYKEAPQTGHNDTLVAFWLLGRRGDKKRSSTH